MDQRTPEELRKITQYWKELMKSASKGMLDAGWINTTDLMAMENDLDSICEDENAVFFYHFVQISATV